MKKQKAALSGSLKQEFEKDLELFQYILVLLNDASPIRNVELMWAEDLELFEPQQTIRLSTGEALVQLHPEPHAGQARTTPSTLFCDLVHGFGVHVDRTCARSDEPAKARCRATGCSQVYPCHVGLTDIAVPVMCDGRYLGTLFSGQVLVDPPTAEGFAAVKAALQDQPHIDLEKLERAYFRVPVVTRAQLAEMTRMLEVFARYIGNSWKRLQIMGEFQRVRERELALDRRQLAEMLLSGEIANHHELHLLIANVGLKHIPDRVMVLRMRADGQSEEPAIGSHLTLGRVSHMIEDLCQGWPDTLACSVRPGEICIFTGQQFRSTAHEHMSLEEMAQSLLRAVRGQQVPEARIGVSLVHPQPQQLLRAYHEACSAIDSGLSSINFFAEATAHQEQPTELLGRLSKLLQLGEPSAVSGAVREILALATPAGATPAQLQHSRGFLTWACEHLAMEVTNLGANAGQVQAEKEQAGAIIVRSPSPFAIAEAFRCFVEQMRLQLLRTFSQREQKIIGEIQRIVRESDPAKVSVQELANALQLSAGHLSRVYSRTTGHTLEEYLIRQRLETAKRLLLDPRLHVAEVAYRCGFCNPAYFSSVFKKYMHCTPRGYATNPLRWNLPEPGPDAAVGVMAQAKAGWSASEPIA